MSIILKTPRAEQDLLEIWYYIALDNPERATRYLKQLEQTLHTIAAMPHMGKQRPELHPNIRSVIHEHYVIFYRLMQEGVEIVRVLHTARDMSTLVKGQ